jgi:hypothetical protein
MTLLTFSDLRLYFHIISENVVSGKLWLEAVLLF